MIKSLQTHRAVAKFGGKLVVWLHAVLGHSGTLTSCFAWVPLHIHPAAVRVMTRVIHVCGAPESWQTIVSRDRFEAYYTTFPLVYYM